MVARAMRTGLKTFPPPMTKMFTAMMFRMMGPMMRSPQLRVMGMMRRMPAMISRLLTKSMKPCDVALKNAMVSADGGVPSPVGMNFSQWLMPNVMNARPSSAPMMVGRFFILVGCCGV